MKIKKLFCTFLGLSIINIATLASNALEAKCSIDVKNNSIAWTNGLNNNVRIINCEEGKKYFKECKKKLNSRLAVNRIIEEYFCEYINKPNSPDKNRLIKCFQNSTNLSKFLNMGFILDKKSNLNKYISRKADASLLGINSSIYNQLSIDLKDFILYASRELTIRNASMAKEGELQKGLAVKQLATYELAKYLGLESIVVKSEYVKLLTSHGEKVGVLSSKAEGKEVSEIKTKNLKITPSFQKELTCLQLLDTLSDEKDHGPPNCYIKMDKNNLLGVMAFDNEGGFGLSTNLNSGLCWGAVPSIVNSKTNKITLPHLSKEVAEKILKSTNEEIEMIFKDLLTKKQINSLQSRFAILKSAIANTSKNQKDFLLLNDQWTQNTVSKELSKKFGNTYLVHYCKFLRIIK